MDVHLSMHACHVCIPCVRPVHASDPPVASAFFMSWCLLHGLVSPDLWTPAPRDPVEDQLSAYFSHCCVVRLGLGKCLMDEWTDE